MKHAFNLVSWLSVAILAAIVLMILAFWAKADEPKYLLHGVICKESCIEFFGFDTSRLETQAECEEHLAQVQRESADRGVTVKSVSCDLVQR